MTGDVRIQNLNIGNVLIIPDAAPESGLTEQVFDFLREQQKARAITTLDGNGFPLPEEDTPPEDTPLAPKEEVYDDIAGRAEVLHRVAEHVARVRNLEGRIRSYHYDPSERKDIQGQLETATKVSGMELELACAQCVFANDCALKDNIGKWIDVHPYGEGHKGKRRPKSGKVKAVETRKAFLKAVDAGVEADTQVHCDPAERAALSGGDGPGGQQNDQ